jgi:hypothetical protein
MTDNARLAVVLRTAQWELDDVAFALPRGEVTDEQRARLAQTLATLADLLAMPVPGETGSSAVVVPADTEAPLRRSQRALKSP